MQAQTKSFLYFFPMIFFLSFFFSQSVSQSVSLPVNKHSLYGRRARHICNVNMREWLRFSISCIPFSFYVYLYLYPFFRLLRFSRLFKMYYTRFLSSVKGHTQTHTHDFQQPLIFYPSHLVLL